MKSSPRRARIAGSPRAIALALAAGALWLAHPFLHGIEPAAGFAHGVRAHSHPHGHSHADAHGSDAGREHAEHGRPKGSPATPSEGGEGGHSHSGGGECSICLAASVADLPDLPRAPSPSAGRWTRLELAALPIPAARLEFLIGAPRRGPPFPTSHA